MARRGGDASSWTDPYRGYQVGVPFESNDEDVLISRESNFIDNAIISSLAKTLCWRR